ncbi:hypothetical protein ACJIZ3_022460 [Penstemon smallii]|uniref:SET domain-containing protein n=1 Tax=Penstemon smallii TaxID=265156 RepID=A0ABD3TLC3_9LAMI
MLIPSAIITNTWWAQAQKPIFPALFRIFSTSRPITSVSPKASYSVDVNCINFLPWLEEKAGTKICTALSIGKSSHGRALYASENIIAGDCLFKIPYSVQLAPDNLPQDITCLLGGEVGHVAKLALFILREQRLGQNSGWEPYISLLPQPEDLHSTVFWSNDELKMIQPSALYKETLRQKTQIEEDFFSVKLAFDQFPDGFQVVTLQEFTYAYGLVTSRAWGSSRGVSMIPFADFLNHDCSSEAYVLSDEGKQHSEVIADRNYASGDQVMIRYGKFSNATLLLDFGFSVSYNHYDQVQVDLNICQNDVLYAQKLELLDRYQTPSGSSG